MRRAGGPTLRERLSVYVITSSGLVAGRSHADVARAAVEGGATVVQLRAPEVEPDDLLPLACEITELCRGSGVLSIVNDVVEAAIQSGADGVHLGQGQDLAGARRHLGPSRILGVSVGTLEGVRGAEHVGADYLGVTVWSTATKPEAVPVGLDGLRRIAEATSLPVVGIGGIAPSTAGEVLAAGAAGVAVISAVGAATDPLAATKGLVTAVEAFEEEGAT